MSKNNGGPAFPRNALDHGHGVMSSYEPGMPLRDYFAAKAMQGVISQACGTAVSSIEDDPDRAARLAYRMADAMLVERDK